MKKFFKWVRRMFEFMGSYSHDEDDRNEIPLILQLRKENIELAEQNAVLQRMADALTDDLFGADEPSHQEFDALQLRFSSFFLNCNLQRYLHPIELTFIKKVWMESIACAYQLGKFHHERSTK